MVLICSGALFACGGPVDLYETKRQAATVVEQPAPEWRKQLEILPLGKDLLQSSKSSLAIPGQLYDRNCKMPFTVPTPRTDPHSYNYSAYLYMDPDSGAVCNPKTRSNALYFNVSWDRYHGYRQVRFQASRGWSVGFLNARRVKDYPYEQSDVKVQLRSPSSKVFEVVFDWNYRAHVVIKSVKDATPRGGRR